MAEFSEEDFAQFFSVSRDLFNNCNANERFLSLLEKELSNLRNQNQNQNTSKSTKTWLNVFNEWKAQRKEARKG